MITNNVLTQSIVSCPECFSSETIAVEQGYTYLFYRCKNCCAILRPKASDCCVLCSFGSTPCASSEQNLAA